MAENYVKFGESKLRNNCPNCSAQDGLKFTVSNKVEDSKLRTRATKEVKGELTCSHCDSVIYPGLWTNEIDRIYLYNLSKKTVILTRQFRMPTCINKNPDA